MSKSKAQVNFEYAAARLLLGSFGLLSPRLALSVGATAGRCLYVLFPRLRRVGERNLEIAFPNLSVAERQLLLRASFANLGRLLGVFSQFLKQPEKLLQIVDSDGLEYLDAAKKAGSGILLFTGHIGAWELSSFALSLFDHPLSFLVRRIDNPKIEAMI